jgi:hypothetical protein
MLVLLAGCLEPPIEEPPAQCESSDQCAGGEFCDQGLCWGDPPPGPFAAVLTPPAERADLVVTHLAELSIEQDGHIPDLVFAETIEIRGRVVIDCPDALEGDDCDPSRSVAAHIWVRRSSDIAGGPPYTRTVAAAAGAAAGDTAFTLRLPRLPDGAEPYEISVIPDDTSVEGELPPAAIAPPIRFALSGDQDQLDVDWTLGAPEDHKWVTGRIVDAAARGIEGMQVFALGRWTAEGPAERSSTIAATDVEGAFTLRMPLAMIDTYELIARPAAGMVSPTLHAAELYIEDPGADQYVDIGALRMPSYPEPTTFVLPLLGTASGGEQIAVAGAEVSMTTILDDGEGVTAVYTATGASDVDGKAELQLIGGGSNNRVYLVQVRSDPMSENASIAGQMVSVGPGSAGTAYLGGLLLPRRVAVSGTLVDDAGQPVAGAEILAHPAANFIWTLDLAAQDFLADLQPPATTSNDHGDFLLWLDPEVIGNQARYDLRITPPPGTAAPPWTKEEVEVEVVNILEDDPNRLGEIVLPRATHARGTVVTSDGEAIAGATLWVLRLRTDSTLCNNAIRPLGDVCIPPAIPQGLWVSKDDGQVWIALPDEP